MNVLIIACIIYMCHALPSEDAPKNKTVKGKNDDDNDSIRTLTSSLHGNYQSGSAGYHSAQKPGSVSSLHGSSNINCPACVCNYEREPSVITPRPVPSLPNTTGQVPLYKLCSWNVLTWENAIIKNSRPDTCNLNFGTNFILENNVPTAFAMHGNRVFVGVRRDNIGVYSSLNYFNINDIQGGRCPPLKPYPSLEMNELVSTYCSNTYNRIVNVDRFNIDKCVNNPKLWIVDLQGLNIKNNPIELGEPRLKVFSLNNDQLIKDRIIPKEMYFKFGLGITTVVPNILDSNGNCEDAYAYLVDEYNGYLIVYSWAQDRFWRFSGPEFYSDLTQGRFTIRTPFGTVAQYSYDTLVHDGFIDENNQDFKFHAKASIKEHAISFATLHNPNKACNLEAGDITYIGQKNVNGRSGTQKMNQQSGAVFGIQEELYSIACGSVRVPLNGNVYNVVSDPTRLSFLADLDMANGNVYVLSNNYRGIQVDGFRSDYENYGIYYVQENDVRSQYPQCYIN